MRAFLILIGFATAVSTTPSRATDFWNRVETLKTGQSLFQFDARREKNIDQGLDLGVLSSKFSKKITWSQVEKVLPPSNKGSITSYRQQNKIKKDAVVAEFEYRVHSQDYFFEPGWGYGFSKDWSFGFRVPLKVTKYSVQSKLSVNDQALDVMAQADGVSALEYREKLIEMGRSVQLETNQQINDRDRELEMGDIEFLSKLALPSFGKWKWSMLTLVRFPAAPNHNPHDGLYVQDDSGQFDLGVATNWLIQSFHRWSIFGSLGFTVQLSDRQNVSWRENSLENSEIITDVKRDLGDIGFAEVNSEFVINQKFRVLGGYQFRKKSADQFELSDRDTTWSIEHPEEHTGHLGMSYLFGRIDKQAPYEAQSLARLQVAKVFSGPGSTEDPAAHLFLEWFY